jgi:hypothetical protein
LNFIGINYGTALKYCREPVNVMDRGSSNVGVGIDKGVGKLDFNVIRDQTINRLSEYESSGASAHKYVVDNPNYG